MMELTECTETDIVRGSPTEEEDQEVLKEKTGLCDDALLMETMVCTK